MYRKIFKIVRIQAVSKIIFCLENCSFLNNYTKYTRTNFFISCGNKALKKRPKFEKTWTIIMDLNAVLCIRIDRASGNFENWIDLFYNFIFKLTWNTKFG